MSILFPLLLQSKFIKKKQKKLQEYQDFFLKSENIIIYFKFRRKHTITELNPSCPQWKEMILVQVEKERAKKKRKKKKKRKRRKSHYKKQTITELKERNNSNANMSRLSTSKLCSFVLDNNNNNIIINDSTRHLQGQIIHL